MTSLDWSMIAANFALLGDQTRSRPIRHIGQWLRQVEGLREHA